MPIDLTGITNENEFYTHHYLSAILENDLKEVFKEWKRREQEEEVRPPYVELRALARDFFTMRNRLERERKAAERIEIQRDFGRRLLSLLGYPFQLDVKELDYGNLIPVIGEVKKLSGAPELWIMEALCSPGEDEDPLEVSLDAWQYPDGMEAGADILETTIEDLITRQVFGRTEPPRWVILASDAQLLLLDRSKWNEKRLLRFDLKEIFGRREPSTLQAMAALIHRDSVCPAEGLCLLDSLDENSHKHAFAVSEDLKYALREAIELIGNEAVWYLREKRRKGVFTGEEKLDPKQLTLECLRYMYRLLFLFYIEARPELGYAPMKADAYRLGYSLETLRDIELAQLTTEESRSGTFLHESLQLLFDMIYRGFPPAEGGPARQLVKPGTDYYTFRVPPLRSHLFDPARTPLLNRVRFRNGVLLKVIELMSLSRPKNGKHRRGRISYAQLGINQLGAVYEALLSYRGFFAETDLYEVKKAGEQHDELETAYFVKAEDLSKYTNEERVYSEEDGNLVMYPRGTFIYRLAGRDREKSASYYTPEVLTKCLVNYALKELLKEKTADEILQLTVCEPAMGSAAFLNEAVNQLAEAYLLRKQEETGELIPHEQYAREKQKVKMYLADHNVYGVDLNPVAVELAEVSLWLNTIFEGAHVPWFGMQLVKGNSLIGARRQVFSSELLKPAKKAENVWLDAIPTRVMPGEKRPEKSIYHFLVGDRAMANYTDKVVKEMAAGEIKAINQWRKEFNRPHTESEVRQLERLSREIDRLWERHTQDRPTVRQTTSDPVTIFGKEVPTRPNGRSELAREKAAPIASRSELAREDAGPSTSPIRDQGRSCNSSTTTDVKDRIYNQTIHSQNVRNSSAYRRLKLVMDYWCALWFWPLEKADLLPTREEFLFDLSLIVEGNVFETTPPGEKQLTMAPDPRPRQLTIPSPDKFGFVNVDRLCRELPRLQQVQELAERYRFLHWELEFADLFADRGGFDLVLGNPPWIKVEWNEGGVMGDAEPLFVLRSSYTAPKLAAIRQETLERYSMRSTYLAAFEESEGVQNFLNGLQNYPSLKGMQTNLYKCFLPQAWTVASRNGVSAFLHPEGIYDDPKGGSFREAVYGRLRYHFQFQNQLMLFPIGHRERYSINVYSQRGQKTFHTLSNLFHPTTVDKCFDHAGFGPIPGIKTQDDKWDLSGHTNRIVSVDANHLELFAKLYDAEGTPPLQARLPAVHSQELVSVLSKFADQPKRVGDLEGEYFSTEMWHETNSQKDGTIRREARFPESIGEWVLSGPHFFVGNPFYKTPRKVCTEKAHYDVLDLTELPDDYLPRTNYVPACDPDEYLRSCNKITFTFHADCGCMA